MENRAIPRLLSLNHASHWYTGLLIQIFQNKYECLGFAAVLVLRASSHPMHCAQKVLQYHNNGCPRINGGPGILTITVLVFDVVSYFFLQKMRPSMLYRFANFKWFDNDSRISWWRWKKSMRCSPLSHITCRANDFFAVKRKEQLVKSIPSPMLDID